MPFLYFKMYYIRDEVDGLIGFKYNDELYYYTKNIEGDIIGITGYTNLISVSYEYDSWGNIISITDENGNDISYIENHIGNINPYRYRSYYYDTETKLYYLNSRYYNPEWGRFINADGIIGANLDLLGYNLYAYCSNNPIMNVDSEGTLALGLAWLATTVVGVALVSLAVQKSKPLINKIASDISSSLSGVKPYTPVSKTTTSTKSTSKSKTNSLAKNKSATKAITVTQAKEYAENNQQQKPCTTAIFNYNKTDVIRGERLTINQSVEHVSIGGNVFCDTQVSAASVASYFTTNLIPEIDKNQKPGYKYYYHYHPDRYSHRHIWFY